MASNEPIPMRIGKGVGVSAVDGLSLPTEVSKMFSHYRDWFTEITENYRNFPRHVFDKFLLNFGDFGKLNSQ